MTKKYDMCEHEELDQKVQDDSVMEYTTTQSPPYTMEEPEDSAFIRELNARIDEAEQQFACGAFFTSEEVHRGALELSSSIV